MNTYQEELEQIKHILREDKRGLTVGDISKELKINRNSVAKYLDVLLISGYVDLRQIGPAKLYFLTKRVPTSKLLDYSNDGIIFFDDKLNILKYNKTFSNCYLQEGEDVIEKHIFELSHPLFSNNDFIESLKKDCEEIKNCIKIIGKNQREFIEYKLIKVTFETGTSGFVLILTNVTESVEKEKSLKFRVKFETLIADIAKDFIFIKKDNIERELENALEKIGTLAKVDSTFIFLFSKDQTRAYPTHFWTRNEESFFKRKNFVEIRFFEFWKKKLLKFETVFSHIDKLPKSAEFEKEFFKKEKIASIILVPLTLEGNLIGSMGFALDEEARFWNRNSEKLLSMSGSILTQILRKTGAIDKYFK